jgi:hypothetical protein
MAMAGALSATAFATTLGLGANFGLFGITEPDSGVGRLDTSRPARALVQPAPTAPLTSAGGVSTASTNSNGGPRVPGADD